MLVTIAVVGWTRTRLLAAVVLGFPGAACGVFPARGDVAVRALTAVGEDSGRTAASDCVMMWWVRTALRQNAALPGYDCEGVSKELSAAVFCVFICRSSNHRHRHAPQPRCTEAGRRLTFVVRHSYDSLNRLCEFL